jgi:hypothetical protein
MGAWQSTPAPQKKRVAIIGGGAAGTLRSFEAIIDLQCCSLI